MKNPADLNSDSSPGLESLAGSLFISSESYNYEDEQETEPVHFLTKAVVVSHNALPQSLRPHTLCEVMKQIGTMVGLTIKP